jgi:hypothetical protein
MRRAAVLLVLVLAPVAAAGSAAGRPGAAGPIVVGGIAPAGSAFARGAAAYFAEVDRRGGVNRRAIVYRVLDDVDPAGSARRLVEDDGVLAVFGTVGTATSLAVRDYLSEARVPQLFAMSGAATWGLDATRYPWAIGFPPANALEGLAIARQVQKTAAGARIAVLYEDDRDGKELLGAFMRGLGAGARHRVTVSTEIDELRGAGTTTLVVLGSRAAAGRAFADARAMGWHPEVVANAAAGGGPAPPGTVSTVYVRSDENGGEYALGQAAAFTLVEVLRTAARHLTRAVLVAAARSLNEANNPFLVPGIVVRTSPTDAFPIQQVALQRRSGGRWIAVSGPLVPTSTRRP